MYLLFIKSNQLAWVYNMRKYLLHILIISVVFLLTPTAQVASHAGELEDAKEEVRKYPDEAWAHGLLGLAYDESGKHEEAMESYKQAISINAYNEEPLITSDLMPCR